LNYAHLGLSVFVFCICSATFSFLLRIRAVLESFRAYFESTHSNLAPLSW